MQRPLFISTAITLILAFCLSCSASPSEIAKEQAEKFFEGFSVPDAQTRDRWGMTDFHVFGRDRLLDCIASGNSDAKKLSDSPPAYEVVIPFWCEGDDMRGHETKLRRKFIRVSESAGSQWMVQSFEFRNDQELALVRQILTFVGWSFLAPLIAISLSGSYYGGNYGKWWMVMLAMSSVMVIGYIAYVCFGSLSSAIIATAAFVLLSSLLIFALVKR
jgi:hypothetical protein